MPDITPPRPGSPPPTRRPRMLSAFGRVEGAVLGAVSGGVAGWLTVWWGGVGGVLHWWFIGGLAVLAAALGYRYGRGVVVATFKAFGDAAE